MELPKLDLVDEVMRAKVLDALKPLDIDEIKCKKLMTVFDEELDKGLKSGLSGSSLQMENTFIPELLDGTESGTYLALDLGGTNFRVIKLVLQNGQIVEEVIDYFSVEESIRLGPGEDLFLFLAECIKTFLEKYNLTANESLPLGFTFSFPMTQQALNIGLLVNWTKSFNCSGVIGQDVVSMLNSALVSKNVTNVDVVAILNDTTGTLVAGAHYHHNCTIGLILGTGTNASYIEDAARVVRWGEVEAGDHESGQVIIDPESGAFGDNGCIDFIKTDWDTKLDKESLLPGSFTYEKYFAGKYLGELARIIFCSVLEYLAQTIPAFLHNKDSLSTKDVSMIVGYAIGKEDIREVPEILTKLSNIHKSILIYICKVLSERASLLVSLTIATFLNRMGRSSESVIAVTGSLYKLHPTLASRMVHHTGKMTSFPFIYKLSDDGSGKGAGLVAAIAQRIKSKK